MYDLAPIPLKALLKNKRVTVQNYISIKEITLKTVIVVTNFRRIQVKNFYLETIEHNMATDKDVGVWRIKYLNTNKDIL